MSEKTKTYDKPMKGESAKSFKKYQIYDNLSPEERSLEKVAEIILEKEGVTKSHPDYDTKIKKLVASLKQLSARWFWVIRSNLHDSNKLLKQAEKHEKEFEEVNETLINCFKIIINACERRLLELSEDIPLKKDGSPFAFTTIVKMTYDITLTLQIANGQIRLCFGLPTDNTKVYHEANVRTMNVEPTDTLEMIREVDEELADLYEPNTEYSEPS